MTKFWSMDIKVDANTTIVFDLDDTLYNELDFLKSAYLEIALKVDAHHYLELYAKMLSIYRSNANVFDFLFQEYNIQTLDLVDIYRNHLPSIQPFPGLIEFFEQIKTKNGSIGIITDGRKVTQRNKIRALGIEDYVESTVISEEIGSEKPNKQNYLALQNSLKTSSYWYIADNLKKDFITPKALGWNTLALVDNGLNIHNNTHIHQKPPFTPDAYFLSYTDLKVVS